VPGIKSVNKFRTCKPLIEMDKGLLDETSGVTQEKLKFGANTRSGT
jgi:hypothetical protein